MSNYYVRFADYPAPARETGLWTQVQIEEASAAAGPWTLLETVAVPAYPDPGAPPAFSFETELATLAAGWYRLIWLDASGDTAPTRPVFNGANITPSLRDVALLLATRLRDDAGQLDTFNEDTTPTTGDVEGYIGKGLRRVRLKVGSVPEELADDARDVVALYAAAVAERARWPEQQGDNEGPAAALMEDFKEQLADLDAAIKEIGAGGEVGPVDDTPAPIGTFPCPSVRWDSEAL